MKRWNMSRFKDKEVLKYLKFGAIPLAAVVLIVAIMIVDKPETKSIQETEGTQAVTEEPTQEPTQVLDPQIESLLGTALLQDSVPEINALMETYFQARISCDFQAIAQIFEEDSLGDEAALIERMVQQTEHIETYQNISCYTKVGLEPDSYIVYTTFDIKFYRTDTLAPSLLWCYVRKGEDASYRIVEVPDEKTSQYISELGKTDEVIALSKSVNQALEEAIASDGKLAAIYNSLRSGFTSETQQSTTTAVQ